MKTQAIELFRLFVVTPLLRIRAIVKRRTCAHNIKGPVMIAGDAGEWEPHPHPALKNQYECKRGPFALVGVCHKCGFVDARFGYDELAVRNIDGTQNGIDAPVIPEK